MISRQVTQYHKRVVVTKKGNVFKNINEVYKDA